MTASASRASAGDERLSGLGGAVKPIAAKPNKPKAVQTIAAKPKLKAVQTIAAVLAPLYEAAMAQVAQARLRPTPEDRPPRHAACELYRE